MAKNVHPNVREPCVSSGTADTLLDVLPPQLRPVIAADYAW
jgi:hypothetical protein